MNLTAPLTSPHPRMRRCRESCKTCARSSITWRFRHIQRPADRAARSARAARRGTAPRSSGGDRERISLDRVDARQGEHRLRLAQHEAGQCAGYAADDAEEPFGLRTVVVCNRPRRHGAEVLQFCVHLQLPLQLVRAAQSDGHAFDEVGVVLRVPVVQLLQFVVLRAVPRRTAARSRGGGTGVLREARRPQPRANERRARRGDRGRPARRPRRHDTPIRLLPGCSHLENTDKRASTSCSAGASRSYDQSIAARRVACRSTAPRSPPASSRNR